MDSKIDDPFERRRAIFQEHLKTLSEEEQRAIETSTHASMSHARAQEAEPYIIEFKNRYGHLPYIAGIGIGYYHGDRLVITVEFVREMKLSEFEDDLPWFYRGFEVVAMCTRWSKEG